MPAKPSQTSQEAGVAPPQAAWRRLAPVAVVSAAVLLFAVLKLYSVNVTIGDEHLYFNMALLVNEGLIPHRDFFYTHPPLHLYLAVLVFKLFGYSLALGKLLSNLAMLVAGLLVFAVGRRMLGAAEGALACALFLLSFDPLRISSHFTGGSETFAFAMLGLWLAHRDRAIPAGIAFGLGALIAVYVLPAAGAAALLLWGRSLGRMLRFAAAAAGVVLAGNLLLYGMAGWDFVYQVYLTQFEKGPEGGLIGYTLYHRLGFIMYENRLLTAGSVAGFVLLAWEVRARLQARRPAWALRDVFSGRFRPWEDERCEALLLCVAWFVLYWIFYLSIRLQHAYYFTFIMPVFAWLSAFAYLEIGRGVLRLLRPPAPATTAPNRRATRRRPPPRPPRFARPLIPAAVAVALTLANVAVVQALYVPYYFRRSGTEVSRYAWRPIPYFKGLDPLVRAAFWQPQYDPRRPPSGIARYLQHESIRMTTEQQLYEAVRQHSEPGDAIFGEVGFIPLVASETGRRVAANLIDTSTYRISYGLSRIEDWIAAIEGDHVRLLVVRNGGSPMRYPAFNAYARQNFRTVARVRDPTYGEFEIMRHNGR